MKTSHRHLNKTVLSSIGLVVLLLVAMQLFLLFIGELDDIGSGHYGVAQALIFVLLQIPHYTYLFFPLACLLGALLGLGVLASQSELIILRCSGMSIAQIIAIILKGTLALIIVTTILGETIIPSMMNHAKNYKMEKRSGGTSVRTPHGIWLRNNNSFIHINAAPAPDRLEGINEYRFDAQHQLSVSLQAKTAKYERGHWQLHNVAISHIHKNNIEAQHVKQMQWQQNISPESIAFAQIKPEEMTMRALYHYIDRQHRNHSESGFYQLAFWQRLLQPLATCVMLFLAIPFIFGPLRSATMGFRFLIGASVGFSFYILNQIFGPISLVFQLPPLLAATLPVMLFMMLGVVLLRRAA